MYSWLWMAIVSGILIGFWDVTKKKAFEKNSVLNVLVLYSFFCFIFVSFEFSNAINISSDKVFIILVKSFVIFAAWTLSFTAIKHLPISIITPFDTLNPVFAIIFGILILNEKLVLFQCVGIMIMLVSYYFIGKAGSKEVVRIFRNKYFYFMLISALLSAISATIDKVVLKAINPGQMQFWFYLFMTLIYMTALIYKRVIIKERASIKFDFFIPLMSLILIVADRIYFMALSIPSSQISIVTPFRKVSIFVSVIVGGLIFKEKNLKQKFWCSCLLVIGIAVLFLGR